MELVSSTAEWLLEIGGLTVGARDGADIDIVERGRALARQLRQTATTFVRVCACEAPGCTAGCPLAEVDGGPAACRLAARLADPEMAQPAKAVRPPRAVLHYLQAINAAATAVFHCRRHAHAAGECWFSDDGTDLCGDVLAVAHRLST